VLDAGAVVHGMLRGDIEPTYTPRNCLDVLAQQVVAMVGMQDWGVDALFRVVRQAYGYHESRVLPTLPCSTCSAASTPARTSASCARASRGIVSTTDGRAARHAPPGRAQRRHIPDQGQFGVYLPDGKTLLGTLDEEFVFETRLGDVFTLAAAPGE